MIFFVANDGTVISSVPSPVYQGAANTNDIYLVAPFAENLQASVAFKLPNGVYTSRYPMTQVNNLAGIVDEKTGKTFNGWRFSMPNTVTKNFGTVTAQFFFYSAQSGIVTATSSALFVVEKGVPEILPDAPTEDVYEAILSNLAALSQQLNNGAFSSRAIYAWNSAYTYGINELTFYENYGTYGAFIKSLKADNVDEPFINGNLNSDSWLLVSDFNVLNGLYGLQTQVEEALAQSRDNAKAAAGSAAAAENAMSDAQSSAEVAQKAADRIEANAEYIESVKDGTVAVPKAENDETGKNIANQFAEVNSDIEGLREDITNEAHFRGYLETNAEIQVLSGTPNDYAYSAQSGTVWIYQTETGWTNSGKPVPDQVIPKGTATPLMDGTAQVGNSNTYADALHRHPTDTTRASTAVATPTSNGLMSAADKTKLDGLGNSNVTGVKGNVETTYRTGNVNLTPADIGAVPVTRTVNGHALSDNVTVSKSDVGLGNVANERQWSNNNRPTALTYTANSTTNRNGQTDTVVQYYRSSDGAVWCRIWASGWKEMGGTVETPSTNDWQTLTFPMAFVADKPTVVMTKGGSNDATAQVNDISVWNITKESFQTRGYNGPVKWYACGY